MVDGSDRVNGVLPEMVWTAHPDGRVESVNHDWCDYTGQSPGNAQGDGWLAIVHPGDLATLREAWRQMLATTTGGDLQARLYGADGECRTFVLRVRPLVDALGKITRWCAQIEPAAAGSAPPAHREADFRDIADSIPAPVVVMTPAGELEYVNRQALQYLGMPLEVLRNWRTAANVHPDDLPATLTAWNRSVQTSEPYEQEHRIVRADGVYRWFRVRGLPLRDDQGHVTRWFVLVEDIHDSRQTKALLAGEKQLLDMVARNCPRPEILEALCLLTQSLLSGCRCTLILPDALYAGPGFTPDFIAALCGAPDAQAPQHAARCSCFEQQLIMPDLAAEVSPPGAKGTGWAAAAMADGLRSCWSTPIFAAGGEPLGALVIWHGQPRQPLPQDRATIDKLTQIASVTLERLRAQDSLADALEKVRASETRLLNTLNAVPAFVWSAAPDGSVDFINQRWSEYTGMSAQTARGSGWAGAVHPDDAAALGAYWLGLLTSGQPGEYEARLRCYDGTYRWFLIRTTPQHDEAGRLLKWHGTNTDIEDRKQAEMFLAGEKRLLGMMAGGSALTTILDELCRLVEASMDGALCSIVLVDAGRSPASPTGTRILHLQPGAAPNVPPQLLEGTAGQAAKAGANPIAAAAIGNETVVSADLAGEGRWEDWRHTALSCGIRAHWSTPVTAGSRIPAAVLSMHERQPGTPGPAKQALAARFAHLASIAIDSARREAALRQSEAFLARAQRLSQTGTFAWRPDTDEIVWSDEVYRIAEVERGIVPTFELIYSRVHPEDTPSLKDVFRRQRIAGRDFEHEHRLRMPDGRVKYVHLVAHAIRDGAGSLEYIAALQDVTQRRLSEEALRRIRSELSHMSRVASLGALTASIAHEVSQPLAGIITNANTGLRMLAADPPNIEGARETARRTIRDGNRASEVIVRLRALFARRAPAAEPVDLNEATREVIAMLLGELQGDSVVLRPDFTSGLPPVSGDRVQLQQVIFNLIRNAADALQGVTGRPRQLRVATRLGANGQVQLDVEDNGSGFDSQDAGRLFHAFYTTKATGMGMGLSVSQSIIENHGGHIWAAPNGGPGACFSFTVPAWREPHGSAGAPAAGVSPAPARDPVEMP